MFVVEDNHPIPEDDPRTVYPFLEMEIGQSFLVPSEMTARLRWAAKKFRDRHDGWSYVTRSVDGGTRLWRLS